LVQVICCWSSEAQPTFLSLHTMIRHEPHRKHYAEDFYNVRGHTTRWYHTTYLLTELSPSWEVANCAVTQDDHRTSFIFYPSLYWLRYQSHNPSSRIMALGSTQPLTEISTSNLPRGKGRLARKPDNFTAICEPIVQKMWKARRLTTVWASKACYRDSFLKVLQKHATVSYTEPHIT
jgi:hypothetical protein